MATTLISSVLKLDRGTKSLRYAPAVFHHAIIVSALFLLRIIKSNYAAAVDYIECDALFHAATSKLRETSLEDDDFRCRARQILGQLWAVDRSSRIDPRKEPRLKLDSRLGGNILHDSLWAWREEIRGQKSNSSSPLPVHATNIAIAQGAAEGDDSTHNAVNQSGQSDLNFSMLQPMAAGAQDLNEIQSQSISSEWNEYLLSALWPLALPEVDADVFSGLET